MDMKPALNRPLFFVVGLTYGCRKLCTLKSSGKLLAFKISLKR